MSIHLYLKKGCKALALAGAALLIATPSFAEITASGSDSTLVLVKALANAYSQETGNTINLAGGGSSSGAKACIADTVDLAFLSRALKTKEVDAGLVPMHYAIDAVAVIVNPGNPTDGVTTDELRDLFAGKANWPEGGAVYMLNRNSDSGTRECFEKIVMRGEAFSPKAKVRHDAATTQTVLKVPSAIGYTSAGNVDLKLKQLQVNGVEANPQTIRSGSYPICRDLTFATKGPADGEAQAFLAFVASAKGQAIITEMGYVTLAQ